MAFDLLNFPSNIKSQLENALVSTLHSKFWSTGAQTVLLEETFSSIYGRPAVATSSGGTALALISELFPIQKIAIQSNTYFASCLPWVRKKVDIVLMGSSGLTLMPSLSIIEAAIDQSPDAILITHIGGYPNPDIEAISLVCKQKGIILIEDCAHSPLVKINGKHVGTFGDAAILSFFPTKPIPAGEGGLLILNQASHAEEAMRIRNYGKYTSSDGNLLHGLPAIPNARMNEFAASIANVITRNYSTILTNKNNIADFYDQHIKDKSFSRLNYHSKDIAPSLYKYICFIKEASIKTSPVYDESNQISSILKHNSYPYTFIGGSSSWTPHICLPVTSTMTEDEAKNVVSCCMI